MSNENSDIDVNKLFESVFMAENSIYDQGFAEGQTMYHLSSLQTGFKMGIAKGGEIAQEMGFYWGFLETLEAWLTEEKKTELQKTAAGRRSAVVMKSLHKMLTDFYSEGSIDLADEELTERMERIRNKFKQVMSLHKLNVTFGEKEEGASF